MVNAREQGRETAMQTAEKISELRTRMIELLERAQALADETGDSAAGVFIATARQRVRGRLEHENLFGAPDASKSIRLGLAQPGS